MKHLNRKFKKYYRRISSKWLDKNTKRTSTV